MALRWLIRPVHPIAITHPCGQSGHMHMPDIAIAFLHRNARDLSILTIKNAQVNPICMGRENRKIHPCLIDSCAQRRWPTGA